MSIKVPVNSSLCAHADTDDDGDDVLDDHDASQKMRVRLWTVMVIVLDKKELYIVEGKSADMALALCANKSLHSVHALQGKLINANKHSRKAVLDNLESQKLISKLGCGFAETVDVDSLPYSAVLIAMDPDIDGVHSSALLLSFFTTFYEPLIAVGLVSLIKLPMFRVNHASGHSSYAWSENELERSLHIDGSEGEDGVAGELTTTRFKGIAQFSAEECHRFVFNPASRRQYLLTNVAAIDP